MLGFIKTGSDMFKILGDACSMYYRYDFQYRGLHGYFLARRYNSQPNGYYILKISKYHWNIQWEISGNGLSVEIIENTFPRKKRYLIYNIMSQYDFYYMICPPVGYKGWCEDGKCINNSKIINFSIPDGNGVLEIKQNGQVYDVIVKSSNKTYHLNIDKYNHIIRILKNNFKKFDIVNSVLFRYNIHNLFTL